MLLLAEQNTPIFMFPLVDVFVFLFTSAKIVQAERNTKQIHLFLFTMAMAPAAVKMMTVLGRAMTSPILKTDLQLAGSRL